MNPILKAVSTIENATMLDAVAAFADRTIAPVVATRPARFLLGGEWLGHPVHPLLVTVPIGTWTSAMLLDLSGRNAAAARQLVGVGVLAAVPSALTGWSDWTQARGPARRVGVAHAVSNGVAIALFGASYVARRRSRVAGAGLAMAGAGALSVGGYLGGHLAYVQGVGVQSPPADVPTS